MTEKTFDTLLGKALAEANVRQYEPLWESAPAVDFSPAYLRWRMKLLANPFALAKKVTRPKQMLRWAVCLLLALSLTFGAAMAVSPQMREAVRSVIETLFPPKDIPISPEGLPEAVPHEAQGQEPSATAPGFAIYVDEERYHTAEENGAFYIRPNPVLPSREELRQNNAALLEGLTLEEQESLLDHRLEELKAFYAALPPCELEIRELSQESPASAAQALQETFGQQWQTCTEVAHEAQRESFSVSAGTAWDAPQETHYFYPNAAQGTFHIVLRCYGEAMEGHGARLQAMLDTFSVLTP